MALTGIRNQDEQDYPLPIQDSVTILPFRSGGTTTLVANTSTDIIKVGNLRRFENSDAIAKGSHDGAAAAVALSDSSASFIDWGAEVEDEVENTTASTSGLVTAMTNTTITVDGVTWNANDAYTINKRKSHQWARATEIRKFSLLADEDIYFRVDGSPGVGDGFTIELTANIAYYEEGIRVVSRVAVIGVSTTGTPTVRWAAWGI